MTIKLSLLAGKNSLHPFLMQHLSGECAIPECRIMP